MVALATTGWGQSAAGGGRRRVNAHRDTMGRLPSSGQTAAPLCLPRPVRARIHSPPRTCSGSSCTA